MKGTFLGMGLAALLALQPITAGTDTERKATEASLQFHAFRSAHEMLDLTGGGNETSADARDFQRSGYTLPHGVIAPVFFTFKLGWMDKPVVGLLGKSTGSATGYDRLWLDWEHAKQFTGDGLRGQADHNLVAFGPLHPKDTNHSKPTDFCLVVEQDLTVHLTPVGYYAGRLTLGGRTIRVGIVDANLNGIYGESNQMKDEEDMVRGCRIMHFASIGGDADSRYGGYPYMFTVPGDMFLVDFDGSGKGMGTANGQVWNLHAQVVPLTACTQMPDGRYYQVKVRPDGHHLSLVRDPTPVGRIRATWSGFTMQMKGATGPLWARSTGRTLSVPAGTYQLETVTVCAPDNAGRLWSAPISCERAEKASVCVASGQTTTLQCGPPFRLALDVRQQEGAYTFSLGMKDRAGNSVDDVLKPNGERPPEPMLRIVDARGRVVKTQKFHYG